jgi:hypothetical protein
MTRRKASMDSILGRSFVRKRTARRYFQRAMQDYYKRHPKQKDVEISELESPKSD